MQGVFLAGDIGGTKSNLAFFFIQGSKLTPVFKRNYPSNDYPDLESLVREFMSNYSASVLGACFGVPGPVVEGKCETTNLPWLLDARKISRSLGIQPTALINDLVATAYGVLTLKADEFVVLNEGSPPKEGNMGLIAAGTGLGEAIFYWDGNRYHPLASEGGHTDFAPRNSLEIDLLRNLETSFGHVSYERVVSGPGLLSIYNFLKDSDHHSEPPWLAEKLASGDPSAVISEVALTEEAEICVKALDLFVSIYGAEAGNLALKSNAIRGLYVGGGIAPKILKKLEDGTFMRAFIEKGRFSEFLSRMPVRVVLNDDAALRGAAQYAASQSQAPGK